MRGNLLVEKILFDAPFQRVIDVITTNAARPIERSAVHVTVQNMCSEFLFHDLAIYRTRMTGTDNDVWQLVECLIQEYFPELPPEHDPFGNVVNYVMEQFSYLAFQLRGYLVPLLESLSLHGETLTDVALTVDHQMSSTAVVVTLETTHETNLAAYRQSFQPIHL